MGKNIVSLVMLFLAVSGIIWAGSKIDTKATAGAEFAIKCQHLPIQVEMLETKMSNCEGVIQQFDVMQAEQRHIIDDLKGIVKELDGKLN